MVLYIDITSATNKLLLNTLVFQLKLALTKGLRYTLLIDSIPLNANEVNANFLKAPSDGICTMISSEDLYSMTGGDGRAFSTLIGNSQITIVMSHTSGNSSISISEWREYVVKPEAIMRMGYGEAYVLLATRAELAHLFLNA